MKERGGAHHTGYKAATGGECGRGICPVHRRKIFEASVAIKVILGIFFTADSDQSEVIIILHTPSKINKGWGEGRWMSKY